MAPKKSMKSNVNNKAHNEQTLVTKSKNIFDALNCSDEENDTNTIQQKN
jgi:hypothetical protein